MTDYGEAVRSNPENVSPYEVRLVRAKQRRGTAMSEYLDHRLVSHTERKTKAAGAE